MRLLILIIVLLLIILPAVADPLIIGHAGLPTIDQPTVQRIYTGKVVEIQGIRITPINLAAGHHLRQRFLQLYLQQDEDQYAAYWIVRRYVGKGKPPKDVNSTAEMRRFIAETPGAIGYVDADEVTSELNILLKNR
ncbi:hypothetical protein [Chromatium okenii]|uniref:hypothetical protein n=1 Tax=Chromatium okenii TaxID=61644 RepID=UPI001F5B1F85|nr:hypothetical protein [Chromatium okenii]